MSDILSSDAFSNLSGMESAVSALSKAISKLTTQYSKDQVHAISRSISSMSESSKLIFQELESVTRSYKEAVTCFQFDDGKQMLSSIKTALTAINSSAVQTSLEQIQFAIQNQSIYSESVISNLSKALEAYQNPSLLAQMEHVLDNLPAFDSAIFDLAKSFDIENVHFSEDGSVFYENERCEPECLATEVSVQMEEAKPEKLSLREKAENLKKRLWLLLLIVNMIFFLPQIPETLNFYNNAVSEISTIIQQTNRICYTIRDRSYLRETADARGKIVTLIPYDSTLEIVDDIPRWYQVKYNDEDGHEYSGWISKISVEKENVYALHD